MRQVHRFLLAFGLLGLVTASRGQGLDAQTVLMGWQHTVDHLHSLPGYSLEGTRELRTILPSKSAPIPPVTWKTRVGGDRYRIAWQNNPKVDHQQSFDGNVWYGLTSDAGQNHGIICKTPEISVEVNLDDQLAKQAAGGFFPKLTDIVERPMNVGGLSLLRAYQDCERYLRTDVKGETVTLSLPDAMAYEKKLPTSISFLIMRDEFYPTEVHYRGVNGAITEDTVKLTGYKALGNVYYPQHLIETATRQADAKAPKEVLLESTVQLQAIALDPGDAADYQIKFPPGTTVMDDRITGPARVSRAQEPSPLAGKMLPLACIAILIFIVGTLIAFNRRKTLNAR